MSTSVGHITTPTQRAGAAAKVSPADKTSSSSRFSSRQAQPVDASKLKQFKVPDLTIKDLLGAIPAHCFQRSALRSSAYVVADFAIIAAFAYAASFIDPFVAAKANDGSLGPWAASLARFALWALYSIPQGLVFTGVWVIAHECGHQSYSPSKAINNTVGWFLHSALLVPYHSWRISHARHHAATGHLTRDEVFVPRTREQKGLLPLRPAAESAADAADSERVARELAGAEDKKQAPAHEESWGEWLAETLEDAPAYALTYIVIQQLFGWPMYLLQNSSGQLHYPKGTNHFAPDAVIFDKRHRMQVIVSDIGIALTLSALFFWGNARSFGEVFRYYVVPYLWCNHWLVMITYLQHTDPVVPHYTADEWTFPRGALCTVDRKWLGPVGPYLFHGIAETHVLHHVSSKIPHYHAWEATEALKARLGEHYQSSDENVFVSLWKSIRSCRFVDESDGVCFYKDAHGRPSAVAAPAYNSDSGMAMSE